MIHVSSSNLLSVLADLLPQKAHILEAGAFRGTDTLKLAQQFPEAIIYAFEPVPDIYTELQKNTLHVSHIKTYPLALSDKAGTATFHVASHPKRPGQICQAGSLLAPDERLEHSPITYPSTIQVPTTTIDEWTKKNGVTKIDFMWLDLQGHELMVLKASPETLKTVNALYLEINFIPAYKGQPTAQELHNWVIQEGFILLGTDYKEKPTHFFGNHLYIKNTQIENI